MFTIHPACTPVPRRLSSGPRPRTKPPHRDLGGRGGRGGGDRSVADAGGRRLRGSRRVVGMLVGRRIAGTPGADGVAVGPIWRYLAAESPRRGVSVGAGVGTGPG